MRLPVLGFLPYADESELRAAPESFDAAFMIDSARRHDALGYHRVLIAQSARSPDSMVAASWAASVTDRLGFMIAHRPGFVAPTMAARMLATLDRLSGGRAAVHVITATNDVETQADGDFLTKDERYARSREYVAILRRCWEATAPFDHDGDSYRLAGALAMLRPEGNALPVYWGGASSLGVRYGAECADVYALAGSSLARTKALVEQVEEAGAASGRRPRMLMSIRIVIAPTDAEAWARAEGIVATIAERSGRAAGLGSGSDDSAARRIAEAVAVTRSDADPCLWGGVIEATGGRSHAMALVGSPDTLARTLRAYQAIGIDEVLLRGFDNVADVEAIGRELIPRLAD
jgi:alkanesulfonate monooxygenase